MAFEWKKKLGVCTLKSRSLNGTITKIEGEVFFGLCLDHGDFFYWSYCFNFRTKYKH